MGKAVFEAIKDGWLCDGNLLAYFVQGGMDAGTLVGVVITVNTKIKNGEFQLPHHLHGRLVVFRLLHALIELFRDLVTGFKVPGKQVQCLAFPAPVFHELAG